MPHVEANGIRVRYEIEGPQNARVVAFSNSLGTNLHMWDAQAAVLGKKFRVLRYDTRGHGETSAPADPYSISQLADDFTALLDALSIAQCSFIGLSMGGMIGLWLGVHSPHRLQKLVIANSAAKIGTADGWNQRIGKVRSDGMASVARDVIARWFSPEFREREPQKVADTQRMLETTDPAGYAGCCEAIRDMDQRDAVAQIKVPTLIVSGEYDPVTMPSEGDMLNQAIEGSQHVKLKAAHLSNVEREPEFTQALGAFLQEQDD